MSIKFAVGEYVIVEQEKKHLVLVTDADPIESRGIIEHTRVTGEDMILEFSADDVVTCLGSDPKVGSVHGIRVEIWQRTLDTPLGECDFYYKPTKPFRESLKEAFEKMERRLKKWQCDRVLPVTLEVRLPKSAKSTTGMFTPQKGRDDTDLITLRPATDSHLDWLICHEFGHPIWQKLLPPKIKASWIKKYYSDVKLGEVSEEQCEDLLDLVIKTYMEGTAKRGHIEGLDDEDALKALGMCNGWVQEFHYLRPIDIEHLVRGGKEAFVRSLWPKGGVLTTDKEVRVTEYGNKTAEEWFAEALAMYYCGKSLPEDIHELLDKTINYLAKRGV